MVSRSGTGGISDTPKARGLEVKLLQHKSLSKVSDPTWRGRPGEIFFRNQVRNGDESSAFREVFAETYTCKSDDGFSRMTERVHSLQIMKQEYCPEKSRHIIPWLWKEREQRVKWVLPKHSWKRAARGPIFVLIQNGPQMK